MTESPIKWPLEELQINLNASRSNAVEREKIKQNTASLKDSENTYATPLLSSCFLLQVSLYEHSSFTYNAVLVTFECKVILVFLKGRYKWRLSQSEQ